MEKLLMEKFKNGECDEIDKAMIIARVKKAMKEVGSVVGEFCKSLETIASQYRDEISLGSFAIVLGTVDLKDENDIGTKVIIGRADDVGKIMKVLSREIEKRGN